MAMDGPERVAADAETAAQRLAPLVRRTYLARSAWLSELTGAEVLLKLENLQLTGSFKVRGALSALLSLPEQQRRRGVVAASTGNHGAGTAYAAALLGVPCEVVVPSTASPAKTALIERAGATLIDGGASVVGCELRGRTRSEESGALYVPPYNDWSVVAGQATAGLETVEDAGEPCDVVYVPVGGGGLVAGVGSVVKRHWPHARVVGCSPAVTAAMAESVAAGHIVEDDGKPSLSDGTAGGVEPGTITFDLCREVVDSFSLRSEDEIAAAMCGVLANERMLIEGAGAVSVAACLADGGDLQGQRVVVLISGANIAVSVLRTVLDGAGGQAAG